MSKMSLSVEPAVRRSLELASTPEEVRDIETLAAAARRYAKSLEDRNFAAEIQLRAGRRGGQLLIEMATNGTRKTQATAKSSNKSLLDLGIDKMRSSRWQWLAGKSETAFENYIAQTKANAEAITLAGLGTSDTSEWYTPPQVIERVVAALGAIDLDPCSNATGEPRIPAAQHFTIQDNGLDQPWHGRVYMNPPYGDEIGKWVDKLAEEFEYGNISEAIALVPARTDTAWWGHLPAAMVCFVTGRLSFSDHENPAPFPSAVCYLGPNQARFAEEFISLGLVYVRLETEAAA